jgi:hypothetical protein
MNVQSMQTKVSQFFLQVKLLLFSFVQLHDLHSLLLDQSTFLYIELFFSLHGSVENINDLITPLFSQDFVELSINMILENHHIF